MIRVDEATSARPESKFALGLYAATLALACMSSVVGLNAAFPGLPLWANAAVPCLLGACLGFVFAARPALADSIRTLSHGEAMAWWLLSGALFFCASFIFGRWLPLAGLVVLQIPAAFTLVGERGYARFYVLCGLTMALAMSSARIPSWVGLVALGLFLLLLGIVMAYETFYFGLENAPAGAQLGINPRLPLRAGLLRLGVTALLAAPLIRLTPVAPPRPPAPDAGPRFTPRSSGNIDTSLTLVEAFVYTMLLIALLLVLGALMKWIRSKRRRKGVTELPESIGVPVVVTELGRAQESPVEPDLRTPLGRMIHWYRRFTEGVARRGQARKPSQTPEEFRLTAVQTSAVPEAAASRITALFEQARYAPGKPGEDEARKFERVVEETLARLTGTGAE